MYFIFKERKLIAFKKGKYNYGKMKNFIAVFGRNPLLWFLPLSK